ncbi:MAG: hypothetical protein IKP28_01910 [Clostridia bacterium]|nr:hypothetical protein [Clostridia bacterium]
MVIHGWVGGMAGYIRKSDGNISNCNNYGAVTGDNTIGGIVGYPNDISGIYNCTNSGTITATRDAGGIAAFTWFPIEKCINSGEVHSNLRTGGITGESIQGTDGKEPIILECYNTGKIIGMELTGGISGILCYFSTDNPEIDGPKIENSHNSGDVFGNMMTGGITGNIQPKTEILGCSNIGNISGTSELGGIAGMFSEIDNIKNSRIEDSYNSGNIAGVSKIGGICGYLHGTSGKATIKQCYNRGIINGTEKIGEIIGIEENETNLNALSKLYYLRNSRGLNAIGGKADNESTTVQIMGIENDFSYEEFKASLNS